MDAGEYRHWRCRGDLLEESVLLAQQRTHRVVTEGSCFDSSDLLFHRLLDTKKMRFSSF